MVSRCLDKLKEALSKDLLGVVLYSSIARDEAESVSDIDRLVVHKKTNYWIREVDTKNNYEIEGIARI